MTLSAVTYPAQKGVDAHGVLLLIRNRGNRTIQTVTPSWLPIANVSNVSSPRMTKNFHDVTPTIPGAWKQFVPGYKDAGSVSLTVIFTPELASHGILMESFRDDSLETFRLMYPETDSNGVLLDVQVETNTTTFAYWEFKAYVQGLSTAHAAGDIIVGSIALKLTGEVSMNTIIAKGTQWPDLKLIT